MKNTTKLFFLLITSTFVLSAFAQKPAVSTFDTTMYGKNEKVGKYIKTRGFNMYYESYSDVRPLLLIHGNRGSINNFRYQIPYFSKSYKLIIADSRAHGKSIDNGDSLSYEMMADDLNALLDTLHLDSCYVVGWSDGGINGLLLAIRHPEKVKKLAVTGANLCPDTTAVDPYIYHWVMTYNDSLKKMQQTTIIMNERKLVHLLSYEPHITTDQLKKIQCSTLIIGGDHDVILPKHTLLIAESIPKSYLWIIQNSGHSTPIFQRDQFNEVVSNFFKTTYREIKGFDRFK